MDNHRQQQIDPAATRVYSQAFYETKFAALAGAGVSQGQFLEATTQHNSMTQPHNIRTMPGMLNGAGSWGSHMPMQEAQSELMAAAAASAVSAAAAAQVAASAAAAAHAAVVKAASASNGYNNSAHGGAGAELRQDDDGSEGPTVRKVPRASSSSSVAAQIAAAAQAVADGSEGGGRSNGGGGSGSRGRHGGRPSPQLPLGMVGPWSDVVSGAGAAADNVSNSGSTFSGGSGAGSRRSSESSNDDADLRKYRAEMASPSRRRSSLLLSPSRTSSLPSFSERLRRGDLGGAPLNNNDSSDTSDSEDEEHKPRDPIELRKIPSVSTTIAPSSPWICETMWVPPADQGGQGAAAESATVAFLKDAKGLLPHQDGRHSEEMCLAILVACNYDAESARARLATTPLYRGDGRHPHCSGWRDDEMALFEKAFKKAPKKFRKISKKVKTKSVRECVDFYYRWKKTLRAEKVLAYVETMMESPSKSLRSPERVSWHTVNDASTNTQFDVVTPSKHPEAFATVPPLAGWASVAAAAVAAVPPPKPVPPKPAHGGGGGRKGGGGGGGKKKKGTTKPKSKKRVRDDPESDNGDGNDDDDDKLDSDDKHNMATEKAKPAEGVFIVEAVLGHRLHKGKAPEYLVHWEGYSQADNTWEPAANLQNNVLLKQFLKNQRKSALEMATKKKVAVVKAAGGWGPTSAKHGVAKAVPALAAAATAASKASTTAATSTSSSSGGRSDSKPPAAKRRKVVNKVKKTGTSSQSKLPFRPASKASPSISSSMSASSVGSLHRSRPSSSSSPSKLIWAAVDGGQAAEDPTQQYPCPFSSCSTRHTGLDAVEQHMRKHHVLEKTCLCGRAFISDSSLVQHFKDNVVFDFNNTKSNNMFNCRPGGGRA